MLPDNCTIRLLEESDLQAYYKLIDENRPRLEDFFAGTVAITKTLEDTRVHLKDVIGKVAEKKHYPFIVADKETGKLIASIQIKNIDWSIPKAELGYYIDRNYEGKGIVSNAVREIIAYAFNELKMNKVFIRTYEGNISSRSVAEKNGLIYEATIRKDYKTTSGMIVDVMYYSMIREEFEMKNK